MNNLIAPTTKIRIVEQPSITGTVIGICIRGKQMDQIEYNIIIWSGSERKDIWVQHYEIEIIPQKTPVGFHTPKTDNTVLIDKP